jgi:2,4-dienoyl-CoA reductase-like NADH-dependent reductase (Old Yellow Enzyme family)
MLHKQAKLKRSSVMVQVQQNGKTYVDLASLASDSGYDYEYLRKIAKAGKVDSIKIGASWMMNPEDLERYKSARKNRGPHHSDQEESAA